MIHCSDRSSFDRMAEFVSAVGRQSFGLADEQGKRYWGCGQILSSTSYIIDLFTLLFARTDIQASVDIPATHRLVETLQEGATEAEGATHCIYKHITRLCMLGCTNIHQWDVCLVKWLAHAWFWRSRMSSGYLSTPSMAEGTVAAKSSRWNSVYMLICNEDKLYREQWPREREINDGGVAYVVFQL